MMLLVLVAMAILLMLVALKPKVHLLWLVQQLESSFLALEMCPLLILLRKLLIKKDYC
jgi:hypothetical protein